MSGTQSKKTMMQRSEIYVKKWVDYSSKYGLGYSLSNGSAGVFFNDSTKIILDPQAKLFEYIEKRPNERTDIVQQHLLSEYPKDLQKKVTLLQHFRSYLEQENEKVDLSDNPELSQPPFVYVKKWMKTRHAIMFRLSNKIVQV